MGIERWTAVGCEAEVREDDIRVHASRSRGAEEDVLRLDIAVGDGCEMLFICDTSMIRIIGKTSVDISQRLRKLDENMPYESLRHLPSPIEIILHDLL